MPVARETKAGVVYVDDGFDGAASYVASWQLTREGKLLFAPYFLFQDLAAAIAWALERGERVRVGVTDEHGEKRYYTAGEVAFPDLPPWPS